MIQITRPGGGKIKQYTADPASPKAETAWVLKSTGGGGSTEGVPMGLLMLLTYANTTTASGITGYQFSYRTKEGTTVRTTIS